ncbi:Transketolase [Raoultella planticola]|uniref:Transketolase n=1 Tax=Raoultella planticola TaxID=575 RepID=A0A485C4E3_RAOPL|nr:Transketolase [Raoultella planticola]
MPPTGSLGQGISIAGGMALSHKLAGRANRVFCIVGDGELNEGQCWEAFQFIAHHRLTNLTIFVDWNKQQLDGELDEIICAFDLEGKFRAFGFDVVTVKGGRHTAAALKRSLRDRRQMPVREW